MFVGLADLPTKYDYIYDQRKFRHKSHKLQLVLATTAASIYDLHLRSKPILVSSVKLKGMKQDRPSGDSTSILMTLRQLA